MSDRKLLKKVRDGDKEALSDIIKQYYADIFRFCLYMIQNEEDSKTGEKASVAMAAGILICSGVYIVVSNISGALFSASISIWAGVCAVAGGLTFVQVKRLFSAGEMVFEEA